MPSYTSFLNLSLPSLGEFVDSWNEVVNQNFEDIDDWVKDLHNSLVATSSSSTWAALRGSLGSLADRLDVSIGADGTIDVSGSPDILDMSTSAYHTDPADPYDNPRDRLNAGDKFIYDARQPVAGGRFAPIPAGGPSAGFPGEDLDAGIALRSADFGSSTNEPISSPQRPWAPGLVTGGADPLISGTGSPGQVQLNAASTPAVFNIDGYIFALRENLVFDYSAIPGLSPGDYVWLYIERVDGNYGDPTFKYSAPGGVPVSSDLRVLKSGADGQTSGSTFEAPTGTFDTAPFEVKEGDLLRITGGSAAGEYVIDELVVATPDTKLTIKGKFKADVASGAPYQIVSNAMPNIGAAIAAAVPSDPTSQPPHADGRVYIGRVLHQGVGSPTERTDFAKNGVFDSGWLNAPVFDLTEDHNLGVVPSKVEIWVREDETSPVHRPLVLRQVVTDLLNAPLTGPGDVVTANLLFPSLWYECSETSIIVRLQNQTTSPAAGPSLFTKDINTVPTEVPAAGGEIRIIAWR